MGFVYILTNPSFEEWVKIGMTERESIQKRVDELNSSAAVPFSFRTYATLETNNPKHLEEIIHGLFDTLNPELRAKEKTEKGTPRVREFFNVPATTAYSIFEKVAELAGIKDSLKIYKPDEEARKEEAEQDLLQPQHKQTTFSMLNIPVGTELFYVYDKNIKVITVDEDNTIEYNGENTTLSTVINKYLEPDSKYYINGFRRFCLKDNDMTLREMRLRLDGKL